LPLPCVPEPSNLYLPCNRKFCYQHKTSIPETSLRTTYFLNHLHICFAIENIAINIS
jgi:hypothetical protein